MAKKKTHEEFIKEFYEKNPNAENIEILSNYQGTNKKINCRCKIDGHEWSPFATNLLGSKNTKPYGCPECKKRNLTKTHEEFIRGFEIKNRNSKNIEILGEYKGDKIKIDCKCKIDGYKWSSTPTHLLQGEGCPRCAGNIKKNMIIL